MRPVRGLSDSARELAREVLIHGPISRAELGRRLGLSPASLTRLSKPFLDRGLFIEAAETARAPPAGPPRPLDVRVDARRFVGVKVTGESAASACSPTCGPRAVRSRRTSAPRGHDVDDRRLDARRRSSTSWPAPEDADISGVGVSIGGNVAERARRDARPVPRLARRRRSPTWLEASSGVPVTVENDVVALTTAEHWFGAVRGRQLRGAHHRRRRRVRTGHARPCRHDARLRSRARRPPAARPQRTHSACEGHRGCSTRHALDPEHQLPRSASRLGTRSSTTTVLRIGARGASARRGDHDAPPAARSGE